MTMHPTFLGDLFDHQPVSPPRADGIWSPPWQWGQRGDPYLWGALREHFATTPWPTDVGQLDTLFAAAFEALTGQPLAAAAPIHVPRFAHGGMTSGYVMPAWWRDKGLPYVRRRFLALTHPGDPPSA